MARVKVSLSRRRPTIIEAGLVKSLADETTWAARIIADLKEQLAHAEALNLDLANTVAKEAREHGDTKAELARVKAKYEVNHVR